MLLPPRFAAVLIVLLLIGGLALAAIGGTALAGSYLNGDMHTEHDEGKIVRIDGDTSFWLRTTTGQTVQFACSERCKVALPHLLRHEQEHASTDVYYVRLMNNALMALDVD